jgi:hypothetical protein
MKSEQAVLPNPCLEEEEEEEEDRARLSLLYFVKYSQREKCFK